MAIHKKTSGRKSASFFDVQKILIAAIFLWAVHVWTTLVIIPQQDYQSSSNNNFHSPGSIRNNAALSSPSSSSSMVSYKLASEQSDNFFSDISDTHWKIAQKYHAALFPNYYSNLMKYSNGPSDKGNYAALKDSSWWNGENFQVEFICPLARRLPPDSMADGPKWVCNPHQIAKKKDCLIYSVGSNGKAEFEKAVKEEIGDHCEIHTFDPVASNKRNGDFATALKPYSTFHHWGLSTEEEATNMPHKFKTLKQTMDLLGHTGKTIDVFKIDCEWCEWFTWQEWLTVDMRQILVETHNAPMPNARNFFFNLHDSGFVIFSKEANYQNGAGGVEFAFVKLSTDFFINDTMYYKKELLGSGS
mmetsp:Transcript_20726/g.44987  ORF Transcript_20726/g.44987 Transcript_20726/m.44987 type:complete len:359 (+) Transcript_20726:238-1314(+)